MPTFRACSLTHDYRLSSTSPVMLEAIAAAECSPRMPDSALEPCDLDVENRFGFIAIRFPDGVEAKGNALHVVQAWQDFLSRQAGLTHAGQAFVPAASVIGARGRLLLVGGKRSGRTTLALDLLMRGYDVEGDTYALVAGRSVMMAPSRFFAADDIRALVPAVSGLVDAAPKQRGWHGQEASAIDPSLPDRPWTIRRGGVAGLVFLEPNLGGASVMGRISPDAALSRLMALAMMPEAGVALAAARLRSLTIETPAYRMSLGDLESAAWHIGRAMPPAHPARREETSPP